MKIIGKLLNILIAVVNALILLLELLTHKWVLLGLLISVLFNVGLVGFFGVKVVRKFLADKQTDNKQNKETEQ
jgi:hypothetical protein